MKEQTYTLTEDDFQFAKREESIEADTVFAGEGYWKTAFRTFCANKLNIAAVIILLLLILLSVIGPYLTGNGYNVQNLSHANLAPHMPALADGSEVVYMSNGSVTRNRYTELGLENTYYLFGTDSLGRDLFTRCWQGLRVSLLVALAATLINFILRAIANRNIDLQSAVFDGGRRIAPLSAPFIRPPPKPHSGFGGCCAACKAQHSCALQ